MHTLKEAMEMQKHYEEMQRVTPYSLDRVHIRREVRHYAEFGGTTYALRNDWFTQEVDRQIEEIEKAKKPTSKSEVK